MKLKKITWVCSAREAKQLRVKIETLIRKQKKNEKKIHTIEQYTWKNKSESKETIQKRNIWEKNLNPTHLVPKEK